MNGGPGRSTGPAAPQPGPLPDGASGAAAASAPASAPHHDPLPPAEGEAAAGAQRRKYFHQQRQVLLAAGLGFTLLTKALAPRPLAWGWVALFTAWLAYSFLFAAFERRWPEGPASRRALAAYFIGEAVLAAAGLRWLGGGGGLSVLLFAFIVVYAQLELPRRLGYGATAFAALAWIAAAGPGAAWRGGSGTAHWAWLAGGAAGIAFCGYFSAEFARVLTGVARALGAANHDLRLAAKELRQHRHHLEELVAQRTAELAAAGDELRRANAELRRLNQAKSLFLANVSHELRTPLTSIRSFSELLLTYPDEALETRTEFLEIIKSETLRLTRLINDVLDWSRIEAGQMTWREEPVDLAGVARSAAAAVRGWAEAKGLALRVVLSGEEAAGGTAGNGPAAAAATALPAVRGDGDRFTQVAANLLSNAIKFTAQGAIEIGVRATAGGPEAPAPEVWLHVRDTGPGIAPEDLPRIFESFQQGGHPLTGKPPGAGLGLAICREIVGHYGGRIWAENQAGGGCAFYCAFPAADETPDGGTAAPSSA